MQNALQATSSDCFRERCEIWNESEIYDCNYFFLTAAFIMNNGCGAINESFHKIGSITGVVMTCDMELNVPWFYLLLISRH